jgi:hypothetical protein
MIQKDSYPTAAEQEKGAAGRPENSVHTLGLLMQLVFNLHFTRVYAVFTIILTYRCKNCVITQHL